MKTTVRTHANHALEALQAGGHRTYQVMVTPTYRPGVSWQAGDVADYIRRQCAWLDRRGIPHAYQWVCEMQLRGVPHYHVLWTLPEGSRLPMADTLYPGSRRPLWPHGMTRTEAARSVGYIVKYASKGDASPLPRGARLFGVGGTSRRSQRVARWRALPRYVRDRSIEGDRVVRAPGGGWFNRDTGEWHPSQFRVSWKRDDDVGWRMVLELNPRAYDAAASA